GRLRLPQRSESSPWPLRQPDSGDSRQNSLQVSDRRAIRRSPAADCGWAQVSSTNRYLLGGLRGVGRCSVGPSPRRCCRGSKRGLQTNICPLLASHPIGIELLTKLEVGRAHV